MRTMKTLFNSLALASCLAFVSCDKAPAGDNASSQDEITVTASVGGLTRAVSEDGVYRSFESGDEISVFVWTGTPESGSLTSSQTVVNNVRNRFYGSSAWIPERSMYWNFSVSSREHSFSAVYPAVDLKMPGAMQGSYSAVGGKVEDVLVARVDGQTPTPVPVKLTFNHVMSLLEVNLTFNNELAHVDPASAYVTVDVATDAVVDYIGAVSSASGEPSECRLSALTGGLAHSAVLPAQEVPINLTVHFDGGSRSLNREGLDLVLESGRRTVLNLNVGKSFVELGGVSVSDWADGDTIGGGEVEAEEVISALNSPAAGTIAADPALLDEYLSETGELVVTGTLNETDLQTLGNWAIDNSWDADDSNNLVVLDLSGTDITEIPYLFMYNNQTKNYSAQYVQKVMLPETVTTINTHAFNCCTALQSINTGKVEIMGNYVFGRCPDISNLDLSALKSIKQSAFRECVNLTSVNMPVVTDLGGRTFNEAYITELRIGSDAFSEVSIDVFDGFDRKGECTLYLASNQTVTDEGKWTPTGGTEEIQPVDVSGFKAVYCGDTKVWPL